MNEFDFNLCNTTQCEVLPAIGSSSLRLCADPPKAGQRPPPDGHWRGGQRPAHRTRCMAGARPRRATRCGSGGESAAGSVTGPPPTPGPRPPQVPAGAAWGEGLPLGDRPAPVGLLNRSRGYIATRIRTARKEYSSEPGSKKGGPQNNAWARSTGQAWARRRASRRQTARSVQHQQRRYGVAGQRYLPLAPTL